jgi:hypothetical protein
MQDATWNKQHATRATMQNATRNAPMQHATRTEETMQRAPMQHTLGFDAKRRHTTRAGAACSLGRIL